MLISVTDVYIEVNNNSMRPLDEYMLFTKAGSEKVNVTNSQGVRSAQCAVFDVMRKPPSGPSLNISFVRFYVWTILGIIDEFYSKKSRSSGRSRRMG